MTLNWNGQPKGDKLMNENLSSHSISHIAAVALGGFSCPVT